MIHHHDPQHYLRSKSSSTIKLFFICSWILADMNFKEAIEYSLSKLNFEKSCKEGRRKAVEGYFHNQYVFGYSLTGSGV